MSITMRLIFDIKCCEIFNLVICNQAYFKYACVRDIQVSNRMNKYISTIPVMFPKFLWLTLQPFVQPIQISWFSFPKNSDIPSFENTPYMHSTYIKWEKASLCWKLYNIHYVFITFTYIIYYICINIYKLLNF